MTLTKTIEMYEAQRRFTELLSWVLEGAEVVLEQDSTPFARLVPFTLPVETRVAGLHAGAIWTSDDFDEPLSEEFLMSGT
ncbi:MAG TPA: toxin-antitoxin (TA) system antitoxin [Thermoflexia bacterium]|nr:toxin-antitoxin (TA) system antitoxin [Thermoflexia bacterium]